MQKKTRPRPYSKRSSIYVRGPEGKRRALFGKMQPCAPEEYAALAPPPPVVTTPVVTEPPPVLDAAEREVLVADAINRLDLFDCVPLSCKLTRQSCAERHMKGKAASISQATPTTRGQVISPPAWAPFVPTCRGCPVGAATAKRLKTPVPKRPKK